MHTNLKNLKERQAKSVIAIENLRYWAVVDDYSGLTYWALAPFERIHSVVRGQISQLYEISADKYYRLRDHEQKYSRNAERYVMEERSERKHPTRKVAMNNKKIAKELLLIAKNLIALPKDQPRLWVRIGNGSEYEPFDSIEEAIEVLKEVDVGPVDHWINLGLITQKYTGHNYISIFWNASLDGSKGHMGGLTSSEKHQIEKALGK